MIKRNPDWRIAFLFLLLQIPLASLNRETAAILTVEECDST